jgi:dTMP kinase
VGRLIVIEGLDGAGKATVAAALSAAFADRGATVARLAFPRYDDDVHAALVRDALYGRAGDLGESVHGMALLFALDRRDAVAGIRAALASHDVLLVDRYIASNAAYGAARLHQDAAGEFVEWLRAIEVDRFGVPRPDHQLLLDVPEQVAADRAQRRERAAADRGRDAFESDDGLQKRTAAVYAQLAGMSWLSPWTVVDGVTAPDAAALAGALLAG